MSEPANPFAPLSIDSHCRHSTTPRMRRSSGLPGWSATFALVILLLAQWLGNGGFGAATAFAASKPAIPKAHLTLAQFLKETTHTKRPKMPAPGKLPITPVQNQHSTHYNQLPPSMEPVTMQPIHQPLTAAFLADGPGTHPLDLTGSNHRLEVQIPPGSLDFSQARLAGSPSTSTTSQSGTSGSTSATSATPAAARTTHGVTPTPIPSATPTSTPPASSAGTPGSGTPAAQPSGPYTLVLREQHGYFSGEMAMLGAYQIQFVDAHGRPLIGVIFHHPLTFIYHYQPSVLTSLELDPNHLYFTWIDPQEQVKHPKLPLSDFILPMHNNPKAHTLSVTTVVRGAGPFDAGEGDPENQSPPSPDLGSVQGNSGQFSYSYPLQVAPAPGGFAPQLALSYSSQATNDQHSYTAPAGDAGEGWALSLGAITAEEYPAGSAGGAKTWYFISGIDGISDRLVQDPAIPGGPWYLTEHLSYLRIQQVTENGEPCFHVWDKDDNYYTFGCTADSLQYWRDGNGLHLYAFDLNLMVQANNGSTMPSYNIMNVHYLQDCGSATGNCPSASQASGDDSIRDAGIEQITYGSGTSDGWTITTTDGTVDFFYWAQYVGSGQSQWAETYTHEFNDGDYTCSGTAPIQVTPAMRCDDPQSYKGGANAPSVMSTLSLQRVTSYVGSDTGGDIAYQYQLNYTDWYFTVGNPARNNYECADPTTNPPLEEYCAGEHLLMQVTPTVYQSGTPNTLKPVVFHYDAQTNTYSDRSNPLPGNQVYFVAMMRWYLDGYLDSTTGIGEHLTYTRAYNNSNGTPYDAGESTYFGSGDNRYDPTYCTTHAFNPNPSLDCNSPPPNNAFNYEDNRAWSVQVVTQTTMVGADSSALGPAVTNYEYRLAYTGDVCPVDSQNDSDCVGDNWLPYDAGSKIKDSDWADFYHGEFRGFAAVGILSPAGDLTDDQYYSTEGWFTPESDYPNYNAGAMKQQDIYQGDSVNPSADVEETTTTYTGLGGGNNNSCDGYEIDPTYAPCLVMAENSTTTLYNGTGSGNSSAPSLTTSYQYDDYTLSGGLVNDHTCDPGASYSYHNLCSETLSGNYLPNSSGNGYLIKQYSYAVDDVGYQGSGWTFYNVDKVGQSQIDDPNNNNYAYQCTSYRYDEGAPGGPSNGLPGAGLVTTVSTYTSADCASQSSPLTTAYTGYDAYSNPVATVDPVGGANPSFYGSTGITGKNGCTLATAPAVMSSAWGKSNYTTCTVYDSAYHALPTTTTNAFGQSSSIAYDPTQGNLPISVTDPNSQTTSTAYKFDGNGNRIVQVSEPGESPGQYTTQSQTNSSCQQSIPSSTIMPCYAIETNDSLYPNAVTETFYDSLGRAVETRSPGPDAADDTIQFTVYNDSAHSSFTSVPFEVAAGSGWLDPNGAKDKNGNTPAGTAMFYDALDRPIAMQDPLFGQNGYPGIFCPSLQTDDPGLSNDNATACTVYELESVSGDPNVYATTKNIDPNNHVSEVLQDVLGNTRYTQLYSGVNSGTLTLNQQTSIQYNLLNEPTSVTVTDEAPQSGQTVTSATTTMQYDDLGRLTQLADPDSGTHTYVYDADGQLLTDTSAARVIGYNDDLLGRVGCVQTGTPTADADGSCTSGTTPLVKNTYDVSSFPHQTDYPVGRLTKSVEDTRYPEGGTVTSADLIQYDDRGRVITQQENLSLPSSWNVTNSLPTYQAALSYNDADQLVTTATSTINSQNQSTPGLTETQIYDGTTGTLVGLSNNTGFSPTLAMLTYNVNALLSSLTDISSAGNSDVATETFSYDGDLRPSEETATWDSGSGQSGQLFDESRSYDDASNITGVTTTIANLSGGTESTETQNFCYDEQNQLVWASNTQTPPSPGNGTCGSLTPNSGFGGASYTTSFVYTHLGQLWQGPLNGTGSNQQYLYCSSSAPHHLQGVYALGATCSNPGPATYLSQYNAHGNVSTRTSNNQVATLSYDPLDQMIEFTIPSGNQQWDAYDAGGTRSLQRTTSGGITQLTVYAFGIDEYHYDGSGNLQSSTHYYTLGGQLLAELSGPPNAETTNFFLTDALGSVLATFSNTAGAAAMLGTQLFGPYGNERYQTGNMGTAKGFTGQYGDVVTGLDYYGSRYYDPVAGVFLSADSTEGNVAGLNPYSYVGGNPETWTDPTGESYVPPGGGGGGGGGSGLGGGGGAGGGCNGSCGGSGGGGGYHHTGDGLGTAPTTVPLVIRQAEQIAAQAWDEGGTAAVTDAAEGAEATVTVVCVVVCVIVVAIGSVLLNPTPLASGELSFPIRPPGPTLTYGPGVNSLALGHSMVTPNAPTTPTTQTGGGGGRSNIPPKTTISPPPPPSPRSGGSRIVSSDLYRWVRADGSTPNPPIGDPSGDVRYDKTSGLCRPGYGISTFEEWRANFNDDSKLWYRLPAGTELPSGLKAVETNPIGNAGHWEIAPSDPMAYADYLSALLSITQWEPCG